MVETNRDKSKPVFTCDEIMRMLPHRFPFLLVDRVEQVIVPNPDTRIGRKVIAIKNVTYNEPYFQGHFPETAVMPGVLQIEALAQAAALSCMRPGGQRVDIFIVGVDEARFRRPVLPGDQLVLTCEIIKDRNQVMICNATATVDGEIACEAKIMAKFFYK